MSIESKIIDVRQLNKDIQVTADMIGAGLRVYQFKHLPFWNSDEELLVTVYRAMEARRREAEEKK